MVVKVIMKIFIEFSSLDIIVDLGKNIMAFWDHKPDGSGLRREWDKRKWRCQSRAAVLNLWFMNP